MAIGSAIRHDTTTGLMRVAERTLKGIGTVRISLACGHIS